MDTIEVVWSRIETWLARYAPIILSKLQPGATDEELRQAEAVMGIELPKEVRNLLIPCIYPFLVRLYPHKHLQHAFLLSILKSSQSLVKCIACADQWSHIY